MNENQFKWASVRVPLGTKLIFLPVFEFSYTSQS